MTPTDQPAPATGAHAPGGGIAVAPDLEPALAAIGIPWRPHDSHRRLITLSLLAIAIAFGASAVAELLVALINAVTNLAFYGRASLAPSSPAGNHLGWLVVLVPVAGGLIVGVMARYGSSAIRGHGIPEAMERILYNESRISPRVTLFKPLSSAVAIGTGGPFGAEGPIIATGGALGSLVGQLLKTTADERKILLAAGATAGMAAIFGTPVAAVLLAVELLLFEYRPRSLIPVALASSAATAVRLALHGSGAVFPMPGLAQPGGEALASYVVLGAIVGFAAVYITRGLYFIEDLFEHLPVHWMWWPAIGALVVGVVGYLEPRTLGVGYDNIAGIVAGTLVGRTLIVLVLLKLVSWSVALGSGTSGGTLAPLFTIGGGCGAILGEAAQRAIPSLGIDPRIAALVGMAAMFAGASRALLASIVFAFETTRQPIGLLPLLAGCTAAYMVSLLRMQHSIMTERLARRGAPVKTDYAADHLDQVLVRDCASEPVTSLEADQTIESARLWLAGRGAGTGYFAFPLIDRASRLVGVITQREIGNPALDPAAPVRTLVARPPIIIYDDNTAREAADHMVHEHVGRLPVVRRADPERVIGMLSRTDLLDAHEGRIAARTQAARSLDIVPPSWKARRSGPPDPQGP